VQNAPVDVPTPGHGIVQGGHGQAGLHPRIDGVAHDPVAEGALDRAEVELAFAGGVLGDVGEPQPVRAGRGEESTNRLPVQSDNRLDHELRAPQPAVLPVPMSPCPPAEGFGPAQDRSAPRATSQVTPRQPLPHFTTVAQSRGNSREPAGRSGNPLPTKNDPDPGKAPGQGHKSRRVGLYAGESRRGAMTCPNVQGGRFRGYVGGYARRAPPRSAPSRWLRRPPRSEGLDGLEIVRVRPLGHSGKCASRQAVR
jgi:hypothetical protein